MSDHDAPATIDDLLDRAFQAISEGDRNAANVLAEQVLAVDSGNVEAEDLLAAPVGDGEIRRLTILFADLVDSTALSVRIEPEIYRTVVGRYREQVRQIVDRYEGHIASTKGDGLLAVFGHPRAHENDIRRAVQAGLDITRDVAALSERVRRRFGFEISARVGVHRGLVYLDIAQDDVYGLAANLAARVSGLAPPGTVVVSGAIEPLVRENFELEVRPPQLVKGIDTPVEHHRVVAERVTVVRIPRGPLVGRQRELAYLQASWAQAEAGALAPPGVALLGEPGIGKSRLATAVADLAERTGGVVVPLIGSPFHTDAGLYPIRALLERRCGIGRLTEHAERLRLLAVELTKLSLDPATVIPLLAPVLGIAAEHGYEPVHADGARLYDRIADGVHEYLLACAGDGPGLVLVEDLHWFDASTVEVVRALLNSRLGHLLVVMTARDDVKLPKVAVAVLELGPLTDEETDELIVALDSQLATNDRRAVCRRCDGVPLYVEEVVTGLAQSPDGRLQQAAVPDALYEPLFARLRARANVVPVVEAAATIGREVDRALLISAVGMSEVDVDEVMAQLEEALVLEPLADGCWRFRHELLREVASELSPPSVRRTLHGRIADALVGSGSNPDWGLVAGHYDEAERFKEAAKAYRAAADDARRRGALSEARTCLDRAIAQIGRLPEGRGRDRWEIAMRLRRGFLASAAEGTSGPKTAADFERCLQLSGADRSDQLLMTLTALYGYYAGRADFRRAEQLLESLRADGQEWLMPENGAGFGMVAWYRGEFESARAKLEAAAAVRCDVDAAEIGSVWFMPNEPIASIYTHLALARFIHGDLAGADAELAKTERRCTMLGFPQGAFSLAYARQTEVLIRCEAGQLDRAADVAANLGADAEVHGFVSWTVVGAAQQAVVNALSALAAGVADPADLLAHADTITAFVERWRAQEVKSLITTYDGVIARLLIAAGRLEDARVRVDAGLQLAADTGMHYYDAELRRLRARTQHGEARRNDLAAAVRLAHRQGAVVFELRSAADDFELRGETARRALNDVIRRFPAGSTWPELTRAQALLG